MAENTGGAKSRVTADAFREMAVSEKLDRIFSQMLALESKLDRVKKDVQTVVEWHEWSEEQFGYLDGMLEDQDALVQQVFVFLTLAMDKLEIPNEVRQAATEKLAASMAAEAEAEEEDDGDEEEGEDYEGGGGGNKSCDI